MKYPSFDKTKIFIIRFVIALYKKKKLDVIVNKMENIDIIMYK